MIKGLKRHNRGVLRSRTKKHAKKRAKLGPGVSHPRHSNGNSHMALGDRRSERITAGGTLGCARGRHPRLGLAVRCGDLTLQRKNMPFGTFFHVQPEYQNGAIFVNIEGFRPCLSKPSYRAPKWALMVRLMQKERLKSPRKSRITENQAFWGHFGAIFGQNSHFGQRHANTTTAPRATVPRGPPATP